MTHTNKECYCTTTIPIPPEATDTHDATTGEHYRYWTKLFLNEIKKENSNRLSFLREIAKRAKNEEF